MTRHYPIIDPIRFSAALLVLAFHSAYVFSTEDAIVAAGMGLLRGGWIGVDLFFAISGLVVGLAAHRDWRAAPASFRTAFMRKRVARIVPLYLVTAVVWLLCLDGSALQGESWLRQALSHATFTHNFWPDTLMSINPPSWSLAHEFQLYVLLVLATPWLARRTPGTILLMAFATAILWRWGVYCIVAWQAPAEGVALVQHYTFVTPGMIDSFGAGVALAAWHRRGGTLGDTLGGALGGALAWVGLLALPVALSIAGEATAAFSDASVWNDPVAALLLRSGIAACVALFLLCALELGSRLSAGGAWGRHLGDLSYGIYLWHAIVLLLVQRKLDAPIPVKFAAVLLLTLVLAELGFWLVERPMLRRLRARVPA